MSGGQIIGGVGGAIVGFMLGGPAGALKGAMYGMQIGGYIDPPDGPTIAGPRLGDLTVQTSTYGTTIPRTYGTITVLGNVFWLENNKLKETVHKKKSGGKGGGGSQTIKTYTYSATFALGLCKGPIAGIRRIWIRNELWYDAGSDDPGTIEASNLAASSFTLYTGSETQLPDSRMQATLGVANVPGYRGLAYIVFKDLQLAKYNNSLQALQIKIEIVSLLGDTLSEIIEIECKKARQLTNDDIDVSALTQTVRGFKLSSISAIKAGFEPLQACFPFDVVQQGYKVKFKPRGSLSVATIEAKDLGAIRD